MISLKRYHKIKDDKKSAVLRHPDGHKITIAKAALSGELRRKLDALPIHFKHGGEVPERYSNDDQMPMDVQNPLDELGEIPQHESSIPGESFGSRYGEEARYRANSGIPEPDPDASFGSKMGTDARIAQGLPIPAKPKKSFKTPGGAPESQQPNLMMNPDEIRGDVQNVSKGIYQQAHGKTQEGEMKAQAASQGAQNLDEIKQSAVARYNAVNAEFENALKDFKNSHINPNQYLENRSGGQKVSTAIGLILGGIGGGVLHQENPALKFLNEQIDRNIKSQMADMDKKATMVGFYQKQFGNVNDAVTMTMAIEKGRMAAKFEEAAAKSQGPIEQGRALEAASLYKIGSEQMIHELGVKYALFGNPNVDPSIKARFLTSKDDKHPAMKELQESDLHNKFKQNMLKGFDQVSKLNTVGNRTMNPIQSNQQINSIIEPLIAQMSKDFAGRYTAQDAEAMKTFFASILSSKGTVAFKRKKLEEFLNEKDSHPLLDSYGIKPRSSDSPAKFGKGFKK